MSDLTVELSGSYREQGRQHGEALAQIIQEIVEETVTWDKYEKMDRVEWVMELLQANLQHLAPGVLDEMHGIAEGSGVEFRDILGLNVVADIGQAQKFCTAMGWADTPDGPIIGKTNDIGQNKEKYHHPFRRKSGDGLPAIWATWPGTVWTNCFVNAEGLAFGGASLGMEARNEAGISSNCMLRVIMDRCGTVDKMIALCEEIPVMHHPAHNVYCDTQGNLVTVELTPEGTYVCQGPGQSYTRATNHFCPGPYEGRNSGEQWHIENSKRRFANLQRLAESLPHTVESMLQVVQDHAEEGQICQHGNADMWSSTAYIAIPSQRRMLIGRGQPCEAEFFELAL